MNKKFHATGKINFELDLTFALERDNEISKNNALLIKNLLEISHGKRVSNSAH